MKLNKDTNVVQQDKNPVLGFQEMHPGRPSTATGPGSRCGRSVAAEIPVRVGMLLGASNWKVIGSFQIEHRH